MKKVHMKSADKPERAGTFGRILRFVLGALLLFAISRYYFVVPRALLMSAFLVAIGIAVFYILLDVALTDFVPNINPILGAVLANVPILLMWIFGRNAIQMGAVSFLAISLILAGLQGSKHCEVMSIPGLIFKRNTPLACLFFSPIDWVEQALARRRLNARR
jgi:hypothetical protein